MSSDVIHARIEEEREQTTDAAPDVEQSDVEREAPQPQGQPLMWRSSTATGFAGASRKELAQLFFST